MDDLLSNLVESIEDLATEAAEYKYTFETPEEVKFNELPYLRTGARVTALREASADSINVHSLQGLVDYVAAKFSAAIAFTAIRNNDKVGLVLFTDDAELYIPPGKGRSHILRVIREILFFQPEGTGTNLVAAMDFTNQVIKRRAVAFLISDFCLPGDFNTSLNSLRPKLRITGRRHDLVAVSVNDQRERELPDIGLLTIEDSETGEQVELDTSRPEIRSRFKELAETRQNSLRRAIRSVGVDMLELSTERSYLADLLQFFSSRERRRH